jgi:hypothetical protein
VHVVILAVHLDEPCLKVFGDLGGHRAQPLYGVAVEHLPPVLLDILAALRDGEDVKNC